MRAGPLPALAGPALPHPLHAPDRQWPEPAGYGMARVLPSPQLPFTDERVDALDLHRPNERPEPIPLRLGFVAGRDGALPAARASRELVLEPRAACTPAPGTVLPGLLDPTPAHRFGPPQDDALVAAAFDPASGARLAAAVHLPGRRDPGRRKPGLEVALEPGPERSVLRPRCRRLARFVPIEDERFRGAARSHPLPGRDRPTALDPLDVGGTTAPRGRSRSLDRAAPTAYGRSAAGMPG